MIAKIITICVSAVAAAAGLIMSRVTSKKLKSQPEGDPREKKLKKAKKVWFVLSLVGAWVFVCELLALIFGKKETGEFTVELLAERVDLFGFSISKTVIVTWIVMAVLIVAALVIRIFFVPKFRDVPRGIQNALEIAVDEIEKYIVSKVDGTGAVFASYIFSIALFMVGCAAVELFGVRAPTSDITLTFALALITFVLINFYGIKKHGVLGRLKSIGSPTPIVFPIRVICDVAVPVSMACRLFGNMLGGMIVMDLLYFAMGGFAVGVPSVVGLYFNVFHPIIQAFIFVTLTLAFINEATETPE